MTPAPAVAPAPVLPVAPPKVPTVLPDGVTQRVLDWLWQHGQGRPL